MKQVSVVDNLKLNWGFFNTVRAFLKTDNEKFWGYINEGLENPHIENYSVGTGRYRYVDRLTDGL